MSASDIKEPDIWVLVFTCEDRIGITHGVRRAPLPGRSDRQRGLLRVSRRDHCLGDPV